MSVTSASNNSYNPLISNQDKYLFHEGKHIFAYKFMGSHTACENGANGVRFTTWAPNASHVWVIGDFSYWQPDGSYKMQKISDAGIWSIFIPNLGNGTKYKFAICNRQDNYMTYKADPYAITSELRPNTASIVNSDTYYEWQDQEWLDRRASSDIYSQPMNTYELHLASWKTKYGAFLSYYELSDILPEYVKEMGYTHVELMPINEHPLDASWGYQATGYFSITSRHGDLRGLKCLIDKLHKANIGVILDWVPGHFCKDDHGLINFDGGACYEYQDYWKANNKGWGTHNFDLGRNEVKSFLISNAIYWMQEFHIDGLRVDAVSNILYLSYGRNDGEWVPNIYGNNQNLQGIDFLRELNAVVKHNCHGAITIAEESTAWPQITTPVEHGGLGFSFKWNMGWMNDTLSYIELDPVYRKYHHNKMNFSMLYHYAEKFILPISHDEVVHGKKSLINKMWGDLWNKFAGLRLYTGYMYGHPGKKLLFMGTEFGQFIEWREYEQLQWDVIGEFHTHQETERYFKALNHFYKSEPALWEQDYVHEGFEWIDADNADQSILSFIRHDKERKHSLVYVCNFTPVTYHDYKIGVPRAGDYKEVFNSDELNFGGSGQINTTKKTSYPERFKNFADSIWITVPPMAITVFKHV